jgi:sugar/nucleoside kinase (ribokinase family)
MNGNSKLAVIGCVSVDCIRVPGKTVKNVFGGSAGYAAIAASFFTNVALISTVGDDYPAELLEILKSRNIDTDGLKFVEGKTAHFDVEYDEELFEAFYHKADLNVLQNGITVPEEHRDARTVYISANDPEIQLELIDELSPSAIIGADTHSMWIEKKREYVEELIKKVDVMFMNNVEVCKFSNKESLKASAQQIMSLGLPKLVVKKGQHGAVLFANEKMYPAIAYETYDMAIVDPTGCGDTVAGGFMGVIASENTAKEKLNELYLKALIFGLVVASFNIMDFSIYKLLKITKEDIWRRYDRFRDMIRL